jgi:hypothetical protein
MEAYLLAAITALNIPFWFLFISWRGGIGICHLFFFLLLSLVSYRFDDYAVAILEALDIIALVQLKARRVLLRYDHRKTCVGNGLYPPVLNV